MKNALIIAWLFTGIFSHAGERPYDFRQSAAYKKLTAEDRNRLEQVRRDQVLLWGALDMYADDHAGDPPSTLDELVPHYLKELPPDPFSEGETPKQKTGPNYVPSKNGFGYLYRKGAEGNRAWVISSVGLPDFPYLAERGNIGLYICKGTWISGMNPRIFKEKRE